MKKRNLIAAASLAVCSLFATVESHAQQELIQLLKKVNYPLGRLEQAVFPFKTPTATAKPTGVKQRMMAMANLQMNNGQYVRVDDSVRFFRPAHTPDNFNAPEWYFDPYLYPQATAFDPIKTWIDVRDSTWQIAAVNGAYTKLEYRQHTTVLDEHGQVKEIVHQYLDPGTMTWDNTFRKRYTYNPEQKMTTFILEGWTPANTWKGFMKQEFTYDTEQRITSQTSSSWDNPANGWKYTAKDTYTYDASGDWTSKVQATWNGTWEDTLKYTYTYDASHKRTSELSETWTGTWIPDTKTLYVYNNEGLRIADTLKNWDNPASEWMDQERRTFTYDADDHHISTEAESTLNGTQWEKDGLYLFTYQGDQVAAMVSRHWDGSWQNDGRFRLEFDGNSNPTSFTDETWNSATNTFQSEEGSYRILFYYEDYEELSVKEIATHIDFSASPNPSKDQLYIHSNEKKIQNVRLTDMQGRTVYQNQALLNNNTVIISTASLPEGTYILSIDADKHKGSKAIVVCR